MAATSRTVRISRTHVTKPALDSFNQDATLAHRGERIVTRACDHGDVLPPYFSIVYATRAGYSRTKIVDS